MLYYIHRNISWLVEAGGGKHCLGLDSCREFQRTQSHLFGMKRHHCLYQETGITGGEIRSLLFKQAHNYNDSRNSCRIHRSTAAPSACYCRLCEQHLGNPGDCLHPLELARPTPESEGEKLSGECGSPLGQPLPGVSFQSRLGWDNEEQFRNSIHHHFSWLKPLAFTAVHA